MRGPRWRAIAENSGFEGSVVIDKIKNSKTGYGLNAATGEYGKMIDMGVIDPVKVVRSALQNATSVATMLLITAATVSDVPKDGPVWPRWPPPCRVRWHDVNHAP